MKEKNDIDQLFKSKLNQKSFELKDSYLADFEQKLDMHNKKGKGALWFIFGALIAFTCLYDFSILPRFNYQPQYLVENLKQIDFKNQHNEDSNLSIISSHQTPPTSTKSISNVENTELRENVKKTSAPNQTTTKTKLNIDNKLRERQIPKGASENTTSINSASSVRDSKQKNKSAEPNNMLITAKDSLVQPNNSIDTPIHSPDVYIDDTIRRQVIIVDTVVRRDTVIINDTIKHKIRLFKKKK